jgi:hypothetical protein
MAVSRTQPVRIMGRTMIWAVCFTAAMGGLGLRSWGNGTGSAIAAASTAGMKRATPVRERPVGVVGETHGQKLKTPPGGAGLKERVWPIAE